MSGRCYVTAGGGGGGTLPSAPSLLTQNLQGQTVAFGNSASAPTPNNPNTQSFFFTQGLPASGRSANGNVVYRSTTNATSGFAPIINTSSFTINGLAGAATGPMASPGAIAVFTDSSATNCVGSTNGSQTQPPTVYYAATTYWYRVTLVDDLGQESARSATQSAVLYQNGNVGISPAMAAYLSAHGSDPSGIYDYMNMGTDFNQPPGTSGVTQNYNYSAALPGGWTAAIQLVFGSFGIWLPVFSGIFSTWNFWAGAFTQLQYDLYSTTAFSSGDLTHESVMSGDVHITTSSGSNNVVNVPAMSASAIHTITWPFTTIMKDFGASPYTASVIQYAMYKWGLQIHTGTPTVLVNNMILAGTP